MLHYSYFTTNFLCGQRYSPYIRLAAVPSLPDDLGRHPVWCAFHRTKNVALTHTQILKEKHRRPCQEMKSKVARLGTGQFFSARISFVTKSFYNEFFSLNKWSVQILLLSM